MTKSLNQSLKTLFPFIALCVSILSARDAMDKPNVILIYLDDAGYGDFAHHGNPTIETPSITQLAQDGMAFPQFYVTSPACSVSRYSLLTGRYPARSGFGSWVIGPKSARYLHPKETTIAEALKTHGYATGMFGKWHMGNPNEANEMAKNSLPPSHGFDEWIGTNVSHDYDTAKLIQYDKKGYDPIPGYTTLARDLPSDIEASESLVGRYTRESVRFIEEQKDNPFFLYLAHNQPHLGLFASNSFKGKSRRGLLGDVMAELDDSVAQIRAAIEKSGISKNTIIIFSSDNGPWVRFRDKAKTKYGEARLHVGYAMPFKDGKGSNWEGGHRVPGIICWPGTVLDNSVNLHPISTLDIFPTLCQLTGAKLPATTLDGRDISAYLLKAKAPALPFTLAYSGAKNEVNAIRSSEWKMHVKLISQRGTQHGFEASREQPILFQIEQDFSERIDRAGEQPKILEKLKAELEAIEADLQQNGSYWDL